jgi:surface antigen
MRAGKTRGKSLFFGAVLCIAVPFAAPAFAHSAKHSSHGGATASSSQSSRHGAKSGSTHGAVRVGSRHGHGLVHYASYTGGAFLNCVAFAKAETGIDISGNAGTWWQHAAGLYERGNRPEVGAIMSFTANGRMPSGHVAVVSRVIDGRTVEIDQANWASRGAVSRGVSVVDVSPGNDWTAVRVGLGRSGDYGSVYPTDGFIYDRADAGRRLAPRPTDAAMPVLNPAPRDLRSRAQREAALTPVRYDEVAEAPAPRVTAR